MVNWQYLSQNMTPLSINTTQLNDINNIVPILINNADTQTEGYLGLGILIIVFFILVFLSFRDDGEIRLDILRSILLSSGFCSILGVIMLVTNFISSFVHVMWFFVIFVISVIFVYNLKLKGG